MEKDLNDSVVHNSPYINESESDKSFVGKVKSIITNTPLSKWFWRQDDKRSTVRRRDEVFEDEEMCEMQPPLKKVKLPVGNEGNNCNSVVFNETPNIHITNNITKSKFNSFHEPVAGPSGIKSRKLLDTDSTISANTARHTYSSNELLNGHKDSDSEESTSGYSSVPRIGSKEQVCGSQGSSKQTSPLQSSPRNSRSLFHTSSVDVNTSRSLFANRSLSPNMNTSLSSRRPSFNASTFGSPNFVDKTIATKKVINSPFYSGRTTYGGASAYSRNLGRSKRDLRASLRTPVQIKPVMNKSSESDSLVLGKTARRILDTLEQYSSPINDAKKIPVVSKTPHDGLLTKYAGANPYTIRNSVASNKELQVPSVSDLLRMKQRIRLQDSTEIVKQIAASSKSNLNTEVYKISTDENEKAKHTGKVKTKVTAPLRQKQINKESTSEVHLIPVALPITTLPKFDLNIPAPSPTTKASERFPQPIKQTETLSHPPHAQPPPYKKVETEKNVQIEKQTTTATIIEYKFSDPLVIAENMKSLVPINNFRFSEPLCKKPSTDLSQDIPLNFKMPEYKPPNLISNKNKSSTETTQKIPTLLTTGSVMDILGKKDNSLAEKFKPAQGTWECSACMIRNQPDKVKCVACETPKTAPAKQTLKKDDFGNLYKMSSDKWECNSCLVRNSKSDLKCVACAAPKPNSNILAKNTTSSIDGSSSGFGDKFKPPSDSWECPTCMIRNKNELTKCVACETPNSKVSATPMAVGVDNKFKPPANSWECTTCLVRNKEEVSKCVACEAPKPGLKSNSTGFGNTFKVKDDEWECGVCMVRNKMSNIKCQCCESEKPGSAPKPVLGTANDTKPISTFNFGIDKASATAFSFGIPTAVGAALPKAETNASSVFGENAKSTLPAPTAFAFGVPTTEQKKPENAKPITGTAAATPALQTSNPLLKPNEKIPDKAETAPSGFKFGVPTSAPINNQVKLMNIEKSNTITTVSGSSINSNPTFNFKPTSANGDINKTSLFTIKPNTTAITTTFSAPTTLATTVANKNMFSFGSKPSAAAAPLTSTPTTQPGQPEAGKPLFKFGSNNHLGSDSSAITFGAASSVNSAVATNGFVTTNTSTFGTSTKSFGAPMTQSSDVKPFTFNSSSATGEPVKKAAVFSFGAAPAPAVTAAPTKAPGFNFGSTSAPSFNFTGGKSETNFNAPTTSNIFGGATASSTGKNGTFNFGNMAPNNNQKAGFSFGAAVNNSSVVPAAQLGFSFGAAPSAAPAQSSGGFNFTGPPPSFNATAKPSFNFTDGGVAAFTAQPTTESGLAAPRKIKRAVRRTQR